MATVVGPKTLKAYQDGTLDPEQRAALDRYLASGEMTLPEGAPGGPPAPAPEPSLLDRAKDLVTGDSKKTATTEAASDLTMSPEWQEVQASGLAGPMRGAGIKDTALRVADMVTGGLAGGVAQAGRMAASPEEQFKMVLASNPNLKPETDEKGNRFFRSANGNVYGEKPGFNVTDIPRIAANVAPFAATGGLATTVPRAIAAGSATQAALETGQATAGGDFSVGEVALAGGLNAIAPAVAAVRGVRQAAKGVDAAVDATKTVADDVGKTVADAVPPVVPKGAPVDDAKLADMARRAADGNPAAMRQLAEAVAVDPAAEAAAKRLGIELPADVLSESEQIRSVLGGVRGKVGSEAEAAWQRTVKDAADKADEVVQAFDGAASPGAVSEKVLTNLNTSRDALQAEAKALYQSVDEVIKPSAPVTMDALDDVLKKSLKDLDGDVAALSDGERMLLRLAERGRVNPNMPANAGRTTHEAMKRTKAELQRAIRSGEGAFATNDQRRLKILERALKDDELANAARIGGEEIRSKVQAAHTLTARQKGLEDRIVGGFGRDMNGSIATLMQGAVADASKGNGARLTKLLESVPKDLHGEVLMTALSSSTRAKQGVAEAGFGFSEFAKTYAGLRAKGNEPVFAELSKALGPERSAALRDLYEISKRITAARANVKQTGKANQPFMLALEAESLVQRVAGSAMGKAAAVGIGGAGGGGLGAVGASSLLSAFAKGNKDVVAKVGKLLISPEFSALAIELATNPTAKKETVRRVVNSQRWRDFAKAANLPRDPKAAEVWLTAAAQAARQERNQ